MATNTYSFLTVSASITGPNGSFNLSNGNTEGGITVSFRAAKNTLTIGADGSGMNSLHADNSGTVVIRLLKVSPVNSLLSTLYDADRLDATAWGRNTITVRDVNLGDIVTAKGCAFQKHPDVTYDKEGPALEWTFDVADLDPNLGSV